MATLVLTAIGTAVGGPIGGAIGAMIGQQIDQRIFAPGNRNGPRLADLSIQTSTYGRTIPNIFGTMRVAGTVIWATNLREDRQSVSQGKGRPKVNVYSYSASFAVALSARPAMGIGRIWADGKLLRGAAGDFKVATGFRFYTGGEDQPVDPLIAAAEGMSGTPAYRGLCYAVFEDMALDSFGNRIPQLSFELIAEDAPISAGRILTELGGGAIRAECPEPLIGYAADGATLRSAIEPLVHLFGLAIWDDGAQLRLTQEATVPFDADALGAAPGTKGGPILAREALARASQPGTVRIGYADVARDHQLSTQTANLMTGALAEQINLPAATDAATAQYWAWQALMTTRARTSRARISLPWSALPLLGGGMIRLPGAPILWRITSLTFEAMRLDLTLMPHSPAPTARTAADAGRGVAEADAIHGPTHLIVFELPWLEPGLAPRPQIAVAAAGREPGWRRAALMQSNDAGASWIEIGETAAPAVMGKCVTQFEPVCADLFDRRSTLVVELLQDEMALFSADEDGLLAGRNLMLVGRELIQFGYAERIGTARYRLSHLLRGRRGTEAEIRAHLPGEACVLIDRTSLFLLPEPPESGKVRVMASGIGDAEPVEADCSVTGLAVRPLAPAHLSVTSQSDGSLRLGWIRRSREGWHWPDAIDAPLSEEQEAYRLTFMPDRGSSWEIDTNISAYGLSSSDLTRLRSLGATQLSCAVQQLGRMAASLPTQTTIFLN